MKQKSYIYGFKVLTKNHDIFSYNLQKNRYKVNYSTYLMYNYIGIHILIIISRDYCSYL